MSDNNQTNLPSLPSQPFKLPSMPTVPTTPNIPSAPGRTLEDITLSTQASFEDLKKAEAIKKQQEEALANKLMGGYLTSDDLILKPWSTYAGYIDDVIELKEWVSKTLSDQDRTGDVAIARRKRGKYYNEMYTLIQQLVSRQIVASGRKWGGEARDIIVDMIANDILGLGPLEPLWRDEEITDITVNGPTKVKVQIRGKWVQAQGARFRDAEHLLNVCQQILAPLNRVIDVAHPIQDGSLVDGSRVNIVHNDIASDGPLLSIRRFPDVAFTLQELVEEKQALSPEMAEELGNYVSLGLNLIVVGGTGAGKTSALNALSACIPPAESIVVIEDTKELKLHKDRDVRSMQARVALQKDQDSITIRKLVRNSLRMTPDRIIVGEVRDFTAYDMLQAMNTGHDGSMTTVHANGADEGVERIVSLLSEGGGGGDSAVDSSRALALIASSVDIFVTLLRYEDGSRRFSGIYEIPTRVDFKEGKTILYPVPLWEFERAGYDENDKVIGTWVKRNELSDAMKRKHSIEQREWLSLEQIYELGRI